MANRASTRASRSACGLRNDRTPGAGRRSIAASRRGLQPRRLGEIDSEPIAAALVAPGHFRRGVAELLLHEAFVDLGGRGEAGAQRMAGEFTRPFAFGQIEIG